MVSKVAAFVAGLGAGYMNQSRYEDEKKRQEAKDKRDQESHDVLMDKAKREQQKEREIEAAGSDVQVTQGAGGMTKPDTMDNRDVGLPENASLPNGGLVPGATVGGQSFTDPAAAQAAAAAQNTPAARAARQGAVLAKYDPAAAAQLRSANAAATISEQQIADRAVRDRITGLRTPEQLAQFISESPADNQGGKLKVQAVKSADGKSFGFAKINEDGSITPVPGTYSYDDKGLEQARSTLAGYMTPEMRMQHFQWQAQQDQHAKEFAETKELQKQQMAELSRHNKATEANAASLAGIHAATLAFQKEKARLDDPTYNLPPAVKLQTQSLQKQVLAAQEQLAKAMATDPNYDDNSKGAMALKGQIATASIQLQKLVSKYIPADKSAPAAADPLGVRTPPASQGPTTPAAKAVAAMPPGSAVITPAATAAASGVPTAAPAPEVTAQGIPRDPNARATKIPARLGVAAEKRAAAAPEQVKAAATAAAAAKTQVDAYKVMGMPGYDLLPDSDKVRLVALVNAQ